MPFLYIFQLPNYRYICTVVYGTERERELRPSRSPLHHLPQVALVGAPALSIRMPYPNIHSIFTAMSGSRECPALRIV
jgi:hypothetical protein